MIQQGDGASRKLSEISRSEPGDVTLQNLLGVLAGKLDTCRRLPVFAIEAAHEGQQSSAQAFRDLEQAERSSLEELLTHLERHLAARGHQRKGIRP